MDYVYKCNLLSLEPADKIFGIVTTDKISYLFQLLLFLQPFRIFCRDLHIQYNECNQFCSIVQPIFQLYIVL